MPRVGNRADTELLVTSYAHRGLWDRSIPENSLAAFSQAVARGYGIELDVRLSRDRRVMVFHDEDLLRMCGVSGKVSDYTYTELRRLRLLGTDQTIPTLEEVLALAKAKRPDIKLGVEIKEFTEENVDLTVALLKKYGFFDNCWFYAFNARIIKYIKTRYNGRTMGYPDFQMQEFEADSYSYYDEMGLSMRVLRSEVADVYLGKGLPVHMYCADTKEDVEFCISKGADLITANDVEPLFEILGR